MFSSCGSLVIIIETKEKPPIDFMHSPFCFLHSTKKLPQQKLHIFRRTVIILHFMTIILSGASVALTSQILASAMLVLRIEGNKEL
jgi:hypothetical protein